MNYSYKRYWEPSLSESLLLGIPLGAASTALTYPFEFVKTRIQLRTELIGGRNKQTFVGMNPHKIFRLIHETGVGFSGFFQGVNAAVYGRAVYLGVRNTVYKVIYDHFKPVKKHNDLTNREKAVISGFAGSLAAIASNPFELIYTRIIADGAFKKEIRRNYKSVGHAYSKIVAEEGSQALFKGAFTNVLRAIVINATLTGSYDYLNEKMWISFGDFGYGPFVATGWAAFWASLVSLPLDNIRTRIYKNFPGKNDNNRFNYKNFRDVLRVIMEYENLQTPYNGFTPYYAKMFVVCLFTTYFTDLYTDARKREAGLKEWQI